MSMDKAIASGKEHRKKYRGAKSVYRSCRNGGSCAWCQNNRHYKNLKRLQKMLDKEKDMQYNTNINNRKECDSYDVFIKN